MFTHLIDRLIDTEWFYSLVNRKLAKDKINQILPHLNDTIFELLTNYKERECIDDILFELMLINDNPFKDLRLPSKFYKILFLSSLKKSKINTLKEYDIIKHMYIEIASDTCNWNLKEIEYYLRKYMNLTELGIGQLNEMAVTRSKAIDIIRSKSNQLSIHILKCILFNDTANQHWMHEIDNWISDIDGIKLKGGFKFDFKIFYEFLWNDMLANENKINDEINKLTNMYSNYHTSRVKIESIPRIIKDIYVDICMDLSSNKTKSIKEYLSRY